MPSSPLTAETLGHESALAQGLSKLDALIDEGVGLSGHERNCAFLNVPGLEGGRRFATASAVLGLDFEDDARAPALVDWDRDGDLDVWLANRSAPMLRFVRNESDSENAWLALRLQGTLANRDGIGSRVQLRLENGEILTQTLKAGEGYLAQSSKCLHFGLGRDPQILEVLVTWPGGKVEGFAGVTLNKRFRLVEGKGTAVADERGPAPSLDSGGRSLRPPSSSVRALTASGVPLPKLPYKTFAGERKQVGGLSKRRTLINLWATWCEPCRAELLAFASHAKDFERAGLDVLALSVDEESADAAGFYKKLGIPFDAGRSTPELVRRLEMAYATLYGPRWPLPVPASVLLDEKGVVLAFYKGAITPEQLLEDCQLAKRGPDEWHDASLPLSGRWVFRPKPLDPLGLAIDLMNQGQLADAQELAMRAAPIYRERRSEYSKFLTWLGDALMKENRAEEALAWYRKALAEDETVIVVLNNLAWQLAAHPDASIRNGKEAVKWASKAAALTKEADASILDTLAAAYAEAGDFKRAVQVGEKAAALAKVQGNQLLWQSLQQGLGLYRAGNAYPASR